jgi:hypothetical protein
MYPNPAQAAGLASRPNSLIRSQQPVARVQFLNRPVLDAGVTAVYSTAEGKVEHLGRLLTTSEALSGRYKTMYEVDVTRRASSASTAHNSLPTRDDRFYFTATVEMGWRVTDPAKVVEERVDNGDHIVITHVINLMRRISRKYEIEECHIVEHEINRVASGVPIQLRDVGISIDYVSAHVTLDQAAQQYLQNQAQIDRAIDLQKRDHARQKDALQHSQELENEQMSAIASGVQGEFGLITMHLRHHPEEALQVLHLLHSRQQELEQLQAARFGNSAEMFSKMLDAGLLQNIDTEEIRDAVLRNIMTTVTGMAQTPKTALYDVASVPLNADLQTAVSASVPHGSALPAQTANIPGKPYPGGDVAASGDPSGVTGWRQRRPNHPGPGGTD